MLNYIKDLFEIGGNSSFASSNTQNYSQDFIPIKDIYKGMIITNDNRYIKVLEILPTNFILRTESEQDLVIYNYRAWLKISPRKTQLKIITKRADTTELVDDVQRRLRFEKNKNVQAYGQRYSQFIYETAINTAVSRRFFLLFEYEPLTNASTLTDKDLIADELEKTAEVARSYFGRCGNAVLNPENPDPFVGEFLYLYYNKKSSKTESFAARVERIEHDERLINNISPEDPVDLKISDLVAPRGISFEEKGYCIVDGVYKSHIYLDGERLQPYIYGGWLSNIVAMGDGIDVDIFTEKIDNSEMQKHIMNKMKFTRIKAMNKESYQQDFEDVMDVLAGCEIMKSALANGEDPYYISIFITICGDTYEEMMYKKQRILTDLEAVQMPAKTCDNIEKEAFLSLSPLLSLSPKLQKRSRRNLTTNALACCYPYTAYEMYDKGGVLLGRNVSNSTLCIMNRFDSDRYVNANLCILGTSGAGKSYTLQTLALRERALGAQVFIISPDKQHEFRRPAKAMGGTFIEISTMSKNCINVMDIRPIISPMEEYLDGVSADDKTWLAEKVETLIAWFSLQIQNPEMTDEDEERLALALYKTYEKKGITNDNDSLYIDPEHKELGLKEMPILSDLYNEPSLPENVRIIMSKFITGRFSVFNGHTNVDLDNEYIVFGLEGLKQSKMLAPAMFMVLDIVWSIAKSDRTKKKDIIIDEGWQLVNGSNVKTAEFVQNIFKTIRGYGGSAIFATQEMNDLFALENGKYGNAIISCAETKLVLKLDKKETKLVQKLLDLSDHEVQQIQHYPQGQLLVCSNQDHVPVQVIASEYEHNLITTKASDLKKMNDEKLSVV